MKNTIRYTCIILLISIIAILNNSCKKEATGIDKELFDMSKESSGFVWYKKSDVLLSKSSGSAHPQPYLKTRFNATAATSLDSIGKVLAGASFAEGSLIVKELYDNTTSIGRYAILYKNSGNENADANGWVWGYINADGKVAEAASKKGASCISCHSQSGSIDYTLMNKYFP